MVNRKDCVEWEKWRYPQGYGRAYKDGERYYAHRLAWEEANGPIPEGLFVLHHCDNPPCIRVDHLFLGTQADNLADMTAKGRRSRGPRTDHGAAARYKHHGCRCDECREANSIEGKAYYLANKDRINARNRAHYLANRDCINARHRAYYQAKKAMS